MRRLPLLVLVLFVVGCSNISIEGQVLQPAQATATAVATSIRAAPTSTPDLAATAAIERAVRLTLTAVAPSPTSSLPPASTPTPSQADLLLPAAKTEGELTVIALPRDWMNYGELISAFSRKYGITVNELDPNVGSADELKAIRSARITGAPTAPDVIDVGLAFAVQAKAQNLLQPYKVSTWDTIPDAAKDPEGYWYGDYYGVIAFEINPQFVSTIPEDWPDLLKPEYKVALAGSPTNSYQAMMAVYSASLSSGGSLNDIVPGLRFFQRLNNMGNLSNVVANGQTVGSGQTPIAIRWDYLALADRYAQAGEREIVVVIPRTGMVGGLYAQGISAYAPHPNAAKLWMEFLYSDEGQLIWLKGLGHPIRFADMVARGAIPKDILDRLPPTEPYLRAEFPTGEQLTAADKSVLANWALYVP